MGCSIPWNIGSFVEETNKFIENIPTALSGTNLNNTVCRSIEYVENYTGQTIGSVNVDIKYQNAILYKNISDVLYVINIIGTDASSVKLGDFSIKNSGDDKNVLSSASKWQDALDRELQILGRKMHFFKANS